MRKIAFILSAALLAVVSCNKQVSPAEVADGGPELIAFSTSGDFMAQTRATEVTTQSLMQLYVTAVTQTTSGYGANQTVTDNPVTNFTNVSFTRQNANNPFTGGKYWPSTNPNYRFYAANVNSVANNNGGAQIVLSNQTAQPQTDIVVGYIASPTYVQVNQFQMSHIYAQLGTVTVNAPSGYTVNNLRMYFRPVYNGTYNLRSASWTTVGSAVSSDYYVFGSSNSGVNITTAGGSANSGDRDLWLVPNTYTLTATYTISKGEFTSSQITGTANVTLQKGMNNNITGTLTDHGQGAVDMEFTVTVEPWGNNPITGVSF